MSQYQQPHKPKARIRVAHNERKQHTLCVQTVFEGEGFWEKPKKTKKIMQCLVNTDSLILRLFMLASTLSSFVYRTSCLIYFCFNFEARKSQHTSGEEDRECGGRTKRLTKIYNGFRHKIEMNKLKRKATCDVEGIEIIGKANRSNEAVGE